MTEVQTADAALEGLPPSALLAAKVLEYEGELTHKEIVEHSRLVERTARHAIRLLEKNDLVNVRHSVTDPRKRVYALRVNGGEP